MTTINFNHMDPLTPSHYERVPAIEAPRTELRRGRVRVISGGHEDIREIVLGDDPDGWAGWAQGTRFALDNTRFIDIGGAVYRSETIDRIEPIEDANSDIGLALQACMGVLQVIRDGKLQTEHDVRSLCAQMLQTLEERGFSIVE